MKELLLNLNLARDLKPIELERLEIYFDLLLRWNAKMDLVSPAPKETLVENHIVDCLLADQLIKQELGGFSKLVDIGSGAGLPGVVLSIMNPDKKVYLLEPRDKRCHFLKEVKRELKLEGLEILKIRMEELPKLGISGLDLSISRAIPANSSFLDVSRETLASGGLAVRMMGPSYELGKGEESLEYRLLRSGANRQLIVNRF